MHLEAPQLAVFFLLNSINSISRAPICIFSGTWQILLHFSYVPCRRRRHSMHTILKKVSFRSHPHMFTRARERGTVSVSACVQSCLSVLTYMHLHSSRVAAAALPLQINLSNCIRNSLFFFARESQAEPQTRRHRNMSLGLHSPQQHVHWLCLCLFLSLLLFALSSSGTSLQFATVTAFTHFILLSRTRSFRSFCSFSLW